MKERPILFNGDMVRAILDGRKTQTRRPMKEQPHEGSKFHGMVQCFGELRALFWCEGQPSNYGTPLPMHVGDRFWVRETWGLMAHHDPTDWHRGSVCGMMEDHVGPQFAIEHRANWKLESDYAHWRPPIHMPRWASRIDLEITRVWVERVQDITEEDAKKEGVESVMFQNEQFWKAYGSNPIPGGGEITATGLAAQSFRTLWQSIYGSWAANPWVWAYEFRRIKP